MDRAENTESHEIRMRQGFAGGAICTTRCPERGQAAHSLRSGTRGVSNLNLWLWRWLPVVVLAHNPAEMGDVPRDGTCIIRLHFAAQTAQLSLLQFEHFDALGVWHRSAQFVVKCCGE
jgi:hypothetical protein